MSKATVTKLFIGSVIAVAAGAILLVITVALAFANDVFVTDGSTVVDIRPSALAASLLLLGVVGGLTIAGGLIVSLISWIGALLNTSQLESKAWFLALLLLGIFNLGFIAMIAYVIVGPDGSRRAVPRPSQAAA